MHTVLLIRSTIKFLQLQVFFYAAGPRSDPIHSVLAYHNPPLEPELRKFNPHIAGRSNTGTAQPSAGPLTLFTPSSHIKVSKVSNSRPNRTKLGALAVC